MPNASRWRAISIPSPAAVLVLTLAGDAATAGAAKEKEALMLMWRVQRVLGAAMMATVAFWFARALGIPDWRDWTPGDATDCATLTFFGLLWLTGRAPVDHGDR